MRGRFEIPNDSGRRTRGQPRRGGGALDERLRVRPGSRTHRRTSLEPAGDGCLSRRGTAPKRRWQGLRRMPRREGIVNLEDQLRGDQSGAEQRPPHRSASRSRTRRRRRLRCSEDERKASGIRRPVRRAEDARSACVHPEARAMALLEPRATTDLRREVRRRSSRRARRDRDTARRGRSRAADRGDHGRHPRLRPARAVPGRRHRHRGDGQRLRPDLRRARRADRADGRDASSTTSTCANHRQDRLAGRSPASTRRRRWSTPACPTAAASTRSSRRSRSAARR